MQCVVIRGVYEKERYHGIPMGMATEMKSAWEWGIGQDGLRMVIAEIVPSRGLHGDGNYTNPYTYLQTLFPSPSIPVQFHFHPHSSPQNFHSILIHLRKNLFPSPFQSVDQIWTQLQQKYINLAAN